MSYQYTSPLHCMSFKNIFKPNHQADQFSNFFLRLSPLINYRQSNLVILNNISKKLRKKCLECG